jgi:hypothetical protein
MFSGTFVEAGVQAVFEFPTLLPQSPKCWNYWCEPPCPASEDFVSEELRAWRRVAKSEAQVSALSNEMDGGSALL